MLTLEGLDEAVEVLVQMLAFEEFATVELFKKSSNERLHGIAEGEIHGHGRRLPNGHEFSG